VANEKKSLIIKVLIILFGHHWEVKLTYRYIFAFKSLTGLSSMILFPIFATGVIDTSGKFAAVVVNTGGKLPPVSLTPVVNLDLRISLWISKKFEMLLMGNSGAGGGSWFMKKPEEKSSWHCPYKQAVIPRN
jgi:hypothetical protein